MCVRASRWPSRHGITYISHVFLVPLIFYIYNDKIHALLILCLSCVQRMCWACVVICVCIGFGEFMVTHSFCSSVVRAPHRKKSVASEVASALLHTHVPVWTRYNYIHWQFVCIPTEFPTYFRLRFQIYLADYCDCFGKISMNHSVVQKSNPVYSLNTLISTCRVCPCSEYVLSSRVDDVILWKLLYMLFLCFGIAFQSTSVSAITNEKQGWHTEHRHIVLISLCVCVRKIISSRWAMPPDSKWEWELRESHAAKVYFD